MHASSLENMRRCYLRYVAGGPLEQRADTIVLDVGGADINGSYRDVFPNPPFRYWVADIAPGTGVDVVLSDPYRIPLPEGSVDIVISGQTMEHIEFFWRTFEEMVRIVRPDGFVFLILPSAGPIHRYPVDCYRFLPDAYDVLAKYAGCTPVEVWRDERGPWCDLVGVFRRADAPPLPAVTQRRAPAPLPWSGPPGTAEEEALDGAAKQLRLLLQPAGQPMRLIHSLRYVVHEFGSLDHDLRQRRTAVPKMAVRNQIGSLVDVDQEFVLNRQFKHIPAPVIVGVVISAEPDKLFLAGELSENLKHAKIA